ncbi:DEAD/DEAH box helicase [Candidatus Uhrbacteria bacterium]|nr:DEAD/DEAH box helicase [Candidatus Uhrbacteria bacterium]
MRPENPNATFASLGIAPNVLQRLDEMKFLHPTPIQEKAIPQGIAGEDLIGIAQTGTGKTLAFAIPVMQRVAATKKMGLVILPTRELALQVDETFRKVGGPFGLRTAVLIGGGSMHTQLKDIRRKPHVVIATPGRLIDHMDQKHISLGTVGILVLDEADRMLDMGFEPQLKRILTGVPTERQTLLFSATMPEQIAQIARKYMKQPLRVEVARSGTAAEHVDQEVFIVSKADKLSLLQKVLGEYRGTILVFSRTKHGAKKIARAVRQMGHTSAELHSNRSLAQRKQALEGFKSGAYRVLVATDIAARGIDVTGIELVLNFDLPDHTEDYVHRIGRTGRAGRAGKAISFAVPEQKNDIRQIERLINMRLSVKSHTGETLERFVEAPASVPERPPRAYRSGGRPFHRQGRSGQSGHSRHRPTKNPSR